MHYLADIKGVRETEEGTEILLRIPQTNIANDILRKKMGQAEIRLDDGRSISNAQRSKIFATIGDIALHTGIPREDLRDELTWLFCLESENDLFSLSRNSTNTASMDLAREFISWLIEFAFKWDIPLLDSGLNRTDDINRYLFCCIKYRRCAITNKPGAAIHHVEGSRIGMGNNRRKVSHINRELIALSAEWHKKVHDEGEEEIFKAFKVYGIKVDIDTLRELGISEEEID